MSSVDKRIAEMSEENIKAALLWFLEILASMMKKESEYMAGFQNVHPVEYYEMKCLDKFMDITRGEKTDNGHKEAD